MARLRAAGAVVLGKLAMTKGAYAGYHPDVTVPINPWDAEGRPVGVQMVGRHLDEALLCRAG